MVNVKRLLTNVGNFQRQEANALLIKKLPANCREFFY
jgi:hypothetical protein